MAKTDMAYPPGLVLHGRTYRIQKRVPKDCSQYYPRQNLYLKTDCTSKPEAAAVAWKWLAELEEEFNRIRNTGSRFKTTISEQETEHLCQLMLASRIGADEELRVDGHLSHDHGYERHLSALGEMEQAEREAIGRGRFAGLQGQAQDWLREYGFDLEESSPTFRRFMMTFAKRSAEASVASRARDEGKVVETPTPPPVAPVASPGGIPSLGQLVSRFLDDADKTKAMYKKYSAVLPLFLDSVGDRPVDEIKQIDLEDFCRFICKLPPRWRDVVRKRKITPMQLAGEEHEITISPKTYEDTYIAALRPFLKESIRVYGDQGFPRHLTFEGVKYRGKMEDAQHKQRPMTAAEIKALFEGEYMTKAWSSPDTEHEFWFPLIGLYTGARVNEVCQLNPQTDIRQEEGVWAFDFTDATDTDERVTKSVKNAVSRRLVPIHAKLIELGLLRYVERIKATGSKLLFPQWQPSKGVASAGAREWFGDLLKQLGLRDDTPGKRLTGYHAFRHTMENRALNLQVDYIRVIVGHTGVAGHVGSVSPTEKGYEGLLEIGNKQRLLNRVWFDLNL